MSMQHKKFIRRLIALLAGAIISFMLVFTAAPSSHADSESPEDPAEQLDVPCLIVVDQNDPTAVLYEKNADQRCIPGSTMKIMTCILSIELCDDLDQQVTATAQAALLKESNSLMGVIKGETLTVRQLLYGLMLESGNDAALLLAQALGGSTEGFVVLMNEKAASLGMTNTNFVNPSGAYKRDQYSTARDMSILTCYAMKNETFREIVSTVQYTIEPDNVRRRALEMYNSNKLISDPSDSRLYYEYATGVKTGSTAQGGKCLVASASKDGASVVAVLLGVLDGGSKLIRMTEVYEDAKTILDLALTQQFVSVSPADLGLDSEITLPIVGDPVSTVSLSPVFSSDSIKISRAQAEQLKANQNLVTVDTSVSGLSLPVSEGDECAEAVYRFHDRELFTAKLIATETVQSGLSDVGITTVNTPVPSSEDVSGNPALSLPVWLPPVIIGIVVIAIGIAVFFYARYTKRLYQSAAQKQNNEINENANGVDGSTMKKKESNALRILAFAMALVLIVAIILLVLNAILPGFLQVLENGDQLQIEQYIRSFGSIGGALLGFLLQFMQILSVLFPGGPIQIAIGVVFGTWEGFVICLCGYVLSNLLVFWSARKLGNRLDQVFSGGSRRRLRFISEAKHPAFVVALSCLMPFLPNGLVPYIAARTKITTLRFLLAVFFGCMPTLFLLCAIGNTLLMGNYLKVGILCALLVCGVLLLYLFRNRIFTFGERMQTAWETRKDSSKKDTSKSDKEEDKDKPIDPESEQ